MQINGQASRRSLTARHRRRHVSLSARSYTRGERSHRRSGTAPPAHVIDEDQFESGALGAPIGDEPVQALAASDVSPAPSLIGIGPDNPDVVMGSIISIAVDLALARVLLVLGRHAHVFGRPPAPFWLTAVLNVSLHHAIQSTRGFGVQRRLATCRGEPQESNVHKYY